MRRLSFLLAAAVALAVFLGALTAIRSAKAAFPGENGKFAFGRQGDIWVANADGSNLTQLTTDPAGDRSPRWSPDGTKIAFASNRDGDFEIFVMDADGNNQRQLTSNSAANDLFPAWTPDAAQIVYGKDFSQIYVINADGSGGERKLADGLVPGTPPHGEKVVFSDSGFDNLFIVHLDGSGLRQITNTPGASDDFNANWSPRGNDLVFLRDTTGLDNDMFTIHSSGQGLVQLTTTPNRVEISPVWSPDGTKIGFVGCVNSCEIYVMNGDGSGETQVSTFGTGGGIAALDWQPVPLSD